MSEVLAASPPPVEYDLDRSQRRPTDQLTQAQPMLPPRAVRGRTDTDRLPHCPAVPAEVPGARSGCTPGMPPWTVES